MSELDEKTIMVELGFVNEVLVVDGEMLKNKCKLVHVLLEDNPTVEKIEIKINFNSEYFKRFVMNDELKHKDLNLPFSLNLEEGPLGVFLNYSDQTLESMFLELGYFGADEAINFLRNIVKKIIRYKYVNHKSVEKFLIKNMRYLDNIWGNPNITDACVRRNIEHLIRDDWEQISENSTVSLELLMEYENYIDFQSVCKRELPTWFLHVYEEKLDEWDYVCQYSILDEIYIENMPSGRKNWRCLATNKHVPEAYIEKKITDKTISISSHISFLIQNKGLSENFFLKYINSLIYCKHKTGLSSHPNLTASFYNKLIKEYPSVMLDWNVLCEHPSLPESFFVQNKHMTTPYRCYLLAKNPNISYKFITTLLPPFIINTSDFRSYYHENPRTDEKTISEAMLREDPKTMCWNRLVSSTSVSENFVDKHADKICLIEFKEFVYNTFRFNHKVDYSNHYLTKYL
jgi:hypothetical protein